MNKASQSTNQPSNQLKQAQTSEEKDPLEEMLDRTGCKEIHYSLQECMYEHRDWRKCQDLVGSLRNCMLEYEQNRKMEQTTPNLPN